MLKEILRNQNIDFFLAIENILILILKKKFIKIKFFI